MIEQGRRVTGCESSMPVDAESHMDDAKDGVGMWCCL